MQGHPTCTSAWGRHVSGSLGQGLSVANGWRWRRIDHNLIGSRLAGRLAKLRVKFGGRPCWRPITSWITIAFVDHNGLQIDGAAGSNVYRPVAGGGENWLGGQKSARRFVADPAGFNTARQTKEVEFDSIIS